MIHQSHFMLEPTTPRASRCTTRQGKQKGSGVNLCWQDSRDPKARTKRVGNLASAKLLPSSFSSIYGLMTARERSNSVNPILAELCLSSTPHSCVCLNPMPESASQFLNRVCFPDWQSRYGETKISTQWSKRNEILTNS